MTSTQLFTCFKCRKDFKLRIYLHSHEKKCNKKRDLFSEKERPSCDKNTFMNNLNLKQKIKSGTNINDPQKCTYKLRDDVVVIVDDDDVEDLEEETSINIRNNFLIPRNKVLNHSNKTKMRLNGLKKVMDIDCTSALGQLIDYKKSSIKTYINKIDIAKNYEKFCGYGMNIKDNKMIPKSKWEYLKRNRSFRSALRSSSGFNNKCVVKLFPIDKSEKYKNYFNKLKTTAFIAVDENVNSTSPDHLKNISPPRDDTTKSTDELTNSTDELTTSNKSKNGLIKFVYSLAQKSSMASVERDDEDCYVYKYDPGSKSVSQNGLKASSKAPSNGIHSKYVSFSCHLCQERIIDNTLSQDKIKSHYFLKHKISNFSLEEIQSNKGKVWKLVETNTSIQTSLSKNPKRPPRNIVLHPQLIDNLSNLSSIHLQRNIYARNVINQHQEKTHNFYSDVICID